jgi:hypothetical protein
LIGIEKVKRLFVLFKPRRTIYRAAQPLALCSLSFWRSLLGGDRGDNLRHSRCHWNREIDVIRRGTDEGRTEVQRATLGKSREVGQPHFSPLQGWAAAPTPLLAVDLGSLAHRRVCFGFCTASLIGSRKSAPRKAPDFGGCKIRLGNWFAPPDGNR